MKTKIIIGTILLLFMTTSWYFDTWNESVERIDELVGKNFDYAQKTYFRTDPDSHYIININKNLNEFDRAILSKQGILIDSIVDAYTWNFFNHKKTIWVGKTKQLNHEIIDAIRYKNNIQF